MEKSKFVAEYELNASNKMLFPYINSPSGLQEWFADNVSVDEDKIYYFKWDGKLHVAKKVSQKTNQYVKFEFPESNEDKKDNPYIEFHLESNEITQTSFLKIVDYTEVDDEKSQLELWNNLIHTLKEKVGG